MHDFLSQDERSSFQFYSIIDVFLFFLTAAARIHPSFVCNRSGIQKDPGISGIHIVSLFDRRKLRIVELCIGSALREQFFVVALLNYISVIHNEYEISVSYRG